MIARIAKSPLNRKIALVTGGTRGIGRAIVEALLCLDYVVIATYRDNDEAAKKFEQHVGSRNYLRVMRSDLCSDRDIKKLINFLDKNYNHLDVLINNAGKVISPADWRTVSRKSFTQTLQTNLVGPWLLTQNALPLLERAGDPAVVFIGSTYGSIADPYVIAYSAAKAGVVQLTRAAAKACAPHIRVNAVLPGHIETDMTLAAPTAFIDQVKRETPLKRLGTAMEVAQLVTFIISDACPFITGQTIIVDGGHIL
jgi:NAD(P)-dependent dehydrogenase (short-subunit alcohol dehydrogenase family)